MQHATLCFIRDDERLLLIKKKRGVGEGLWNGPGGKVEDDETVREAAIRETIEETGITPKNVEKRGENRFFFGADPFMHVHIFVADAFSGEVQESEEARPAWHAVDALPYDEMWPDDQYWMPLFLSGASFHGTFCFDDDGNELEDWEIDRLSSV